VSIGAAAAMRPARLRLRLGPFAVALTTRIPELAQGLARLYPPELRAGDCSFADFHVALRRAGSWRRWVRPQAIFELDGQQPFKPLPLDQALPMFEWGLNYAIAGQAHQYLIIHAAAIERNGRVVIFPGIPGAGKSTLAAGLAYRGWRLLSDELALLRMTDRQVVPLARPISLKNQSIEVMRRWAPDGIFSAASRDTIKGTVALLRAPADSIARVAEVAPPGWIVFPRWQAGASARLEPYPRAAGLMELCQNAMNYSLHGARGFALLASIFDERPCLRFTYGALDDAVAVFDRLAATA
jgi:HprK-related kinase A